MPKTRRVCVDLPELECSSAETVEGRPIEEILCAVWTSYVNDDRRTRIPLQRLMIRWPADWFPRMQKEWGVRSLPARVRGLILKEIDDQPANPLSIFVEPRSYSEEQRGATKRLSTRDGNISRHLLIPQGWAERIQTRFGEGTVSTLAKAVVYREISKWTRWPSKDGPSVPRGLRKLLDEID